MKYTLAKLYDAKGDISKRWYVYYTFENSEGKMQLIKKRAGINRFKSKKERVKEGAILVSEINLLLDKGYNPFTKTIPVHNELKDLTISKAILKLRDSHVKGLRPRSIEGYDESIKKFNAWLKKSGYGGLTVKDLDSEIYGSIFFGFSDYLMNDLGHAGISHNVCISHIGVFFNIMKKRRLIKENPLEAITKKPKETGKNIAFTDEQREKLKTALAGNPNLMLFTKIMYSCYIRPEELLKIKIKDLHLKDEIIIVPAGTAKNKKQLPVVIPSGLLADLKARVKGHDEEMYLFGKPQLSVSDKQMTRNWVTATHRKYLRNLKIPTDRTLYSWKHTGVVAAWKSKVDPYDLMRQLRHASLDQMMTYLKSLGLVGDTTFALRQEEY